MKSAESVRTYSLGAAGILDYYYLMLGYSVDSRHVNLMIIRPQ
jgi:hypothetical protein